MENFEDFKTEIKKIIYYEQPIIDGEDWTTENIKCVELFEDDFKYMFNKGMTPLEAYEEYKQRQD